MPNRIKVRCEVAAYADRAFGVDWKGVDPVIVESHGVQSGLVVLTALGRTVTVSERADQGRQ